MPSLAIFLPVSNAELPKSLTFELKASLTAKDFQEFLKTIFKYWILLRI
jgi:hypothetical protein